MTMPVIEPDSSAQNAQKDQADGLNEDQSLFQLAFDLAAEEMDLPPRERCGCGISEECEECEDEDAGYDW